MSQGTHACSSAMSRYFALAVIAGLLPASSYALVEAVDSSEEFNNSTLNQSYWKDWDTWEAPEGIRKAFVYYRSGYDEDGLVLYILDTGGANYVDLSRRPKEYIDDFWKFYEQMFLRMEFDAAKNNDQGIAILMDWEGFSLKNYASADALQIALKMFTALVRMNNAVMYGYNINVNFVAQAFMNVGRPFFGNMLDKLQIYGTRREAWVPKLLRKIPADQLPPAYGGDKSWKRLPVRVTPQ